MFLQKYQYTSAVSKYSKGTKARSRKAQRISSGCHPQAKAVKAQLVQKDPNVLSIQREREINTYIYIYILYIYIVIYIYILIRERVQYMKDIKKGLIYHVVMQSAQYTAAHSTKAITPVSPGLKKVWFDNSYRNVS